MVPFFCKYHVFYDILPIKTKYEGVVMSYREAWLLREASRDQDIAPTESG